MFKVSQIQGNQLINLKFIDGKNIITLSDNVYEIKYSDIQDRLNISFCYYQAICGNINFIDEDFNKGQELFNKIRTLEFEKLNNDSHFFNFEALIKDYDNERFFSVLYKRCYFKKIESKIEFVATHNKPDNVMVQGFHKYIIDIELFYNYYIIK